MSKSTISQFGTAKSNGYKVVDEFGIDISSITAVFSAPSNGNLAVVDEFENYITSRVKVTKN